MVSMNRQLSPDHPINRLLRPHFEGTAYINLQAQEVTRDVSKSVFEDTVGGKLLLEGRRSVRGGEISLYQSWHILTTVEAHAVNSFSSIRVWRFANGRRSISPIYKGPGASLLSVAPKLRDLVP